MSKEHGHGRRRRDANFAANVARFRRELAVNPKSNLLSHAS
jgi:hypothetical protein